MDDSERRIAQLRHGDHLCLIFEDAAERRVASVAFLRKGLAAGERCLEIARGGDLRRTGRPLAAALTAAGIVVEHELERGALVSMDERDAFLRDDRFDPHAMLDLLRQAEQGAIEDGFSGLCVIADLSWVAERRPGTDRLVEYEALLNRFLTGSRTIVLCEYDRHLFPATGIHEALRTHPIIVSGGQVCPNLYYEPPDMVIGERSPEDHVAWMLAQIRRARTAERKLENLSRRLAQQGAALDRADRAKEEFLAKLAHELRNPLGAISNALQVLRLKGEGDETSRRALEAAERQVLHQALLMDDLLEASRVTRRQIELHCDQLDLAALVRETAEGYRESLSAAGLALELDVPAGPLWIRGDRMRLSQALTQLLDNAAKFTGRGGRVEVELAHRGQRASVVVRDDGAGISPELLPHVFEVFTQADRSLDRSQGGLGVGLAVVKGLIELHGGEVAAKSAGTGKGTELTLLLPLDPAPPDAELAAGRAGEETATTNGRRILVVEDNPDAGATLRDFLELSGHEVELAISGAAGVEAARQFHPEVVLCDLGLPGMDGYQVAAELRRDPATASARLIAVTGYGREEDRRKSREAGFDLHLTKPVDPGQLRRLLSGAGH